MVKEKDRQEYEEGQRDSKKSVPEQILIDVIGTKPGSRAYEKGRSGEQLDGDKQGDDD